MQDFTGFRLRKIVSLPPIVYILGIVSMLMDISSEMIHSLLPLFLYEVLGVSVVVIGVIEGLAEAMALVVKVFSGVLSDYWGVRKPLVFWGYAISALTKPLFVVAQSVGLVVVARFFDRFGKGLRGAPRDALITDYTPYSLRGAAFGLRQSLDTVGAFLGPLLAVGLMFLFHNSFRWVFAVAIIPAFFAVFLIFFKVRDVAGEKEKLMQQRFSFALLKQLDRYYWWVVLIGVIMSLARFSEAFLILRAMDTGIKLAWIPLIMVVMNVGYALTAYPFGQLVDRIAGRGVLALGLAILILADWILGYFQRWDTLLLGVVFWGIHMGMTQGVLAAMVAKSAPQTLRGTSFGFFYLASGVSMFFASFLAGWVWDAYGASFTFFLGIGFCVLALFGLIFKPMREPVLHQ